ncbi:hypothetical protein VNO78_05995 [Psophocarpus tetragonolobus]|uniref:Uncharacterized protein n=1 Tax=Psophocarpus tetragonolobus TaxID=3891 RepID=A0AAN9XRH8_PSOTE
MDNARVLGISLCTLIVMMDVIAGILGPEAEIAQNKRAKSSSLYNGVDCSSVFGYSHIVVNVLCSLPCIVKTSSYKEVRMACLIITW